MASVTEYHLNKNNEWICWEFETHNSLLFQPFFITELQKFQQKGRVMYTPPILYYEWGSGGLGGFMCKFRTIKHILERIKIFLHVTV